MIIVFDIGNTHITAGLVKAKEVLCEIRYPSFDFVLESFTDFMQKEFALKKITISEIVSCALSSVVPALTPQIKKYCLAVFKKEPFIVDSSKTVIKAKEGSIKELGADRIADIEAALFLYPGRDLIILDFGTANTFCAVSKEGIYLGGAISAGLGLSMKALSLGAAQLGQVPLIKAKKAAALTTETQIQAGLYFTLIGGAKEIIKRLKEEVFSENKPLIIGTGGLANLCKEEGLFDVFEPNLTLIGIAYLARKNKKS